MKYLFSIIFICFVANSYSLEIRCQFEEVYQDGSEQQGIMFIKDENLRYQYLDLDLYTIINNSHGLFIVNNLNRLPQILDTNTAIIEFLLEQSKLFPNNVENYTTANLDAKIINSSENIFIKNIIIRSNNLNVNIHFHSCKKKEIDKLIFNHNPLYILK